MTVSSVIRSPRIPSKRWSQLDHQPPRYECTSAEPRLTRVDREGSRTAQWLPDRRWPSSNRFRVARPRISRAARIDPRTPRTHEPNISVGQSELRDGYERGPEQTRCGLRCGDRHHSGRASHHPVKHCARHEVPPRYTMDTGTDLVVSAPASTFNSSRLARVLSTAAEAMAILGFGRRYPITRCARAIVPSHTAGSSSSTSICGKELPETRGRG